MDQPKVSVLVPVYNRESMVARCLNSALAQTYKNIEVIVCDNASTDKTFEIIQEYGKRDARVLYYRNLKNIGAVGNWRKCLDYSSGQYIQFLFSDDWLDPHAVEMRLEALQDSPDCGFVYSAVHLHLESSNRSIPIYKPRMSNKIESLQFMLGWLAGYPHTPFSPGAALFRKDDVVNSLHLNIPTETGSLCVSKGIGPDLILYLESCSNYPKVIHLSEALSHFSEHKSSITSVEKRWFRHYCYDTAFGWFLSKSIPNLPGRKRLHTLLYLRSLDPARWKEFSFQSPNEAYLSLFPENYDSQLHWTLVDILAFMMGIVTRITLRLKLR